MDGDERTPPTGRGRAGRAPLVGAADVGARVALRHLLPDGRATDVLGLLLAVAPDGAVSVRSPSGEVRTVPAARVVAVRRVPPRRPPRIAWPDLELVMAAGWVPLETGRLGGWRLRAARGFTSRANSVLPLGDPGAPLDDAVATAEAFYRERGLPPRFAVPAPLDGWDDDPLDAVLAGRGYAVVTPTVVMTAAAAAVAESVHHAASRVDLDPAPDDAWRSLYRYRGQQLPAFASDVLTGGGPLAFASVREEGRTVAVGRAALAGRWAGVTAMEVAADRRRRGLGRAVLAALAAWAARSGARGLYLQVAEENGAGRALYERCGFGAHHRYRYRLLDATPGSSDTAPG